MNFLIQIGNSSIASDNETYLHFTPELNTFPLNECALRRRVA